MRYLLDTNACIRILNNSSRHLVERLRRHEPWEIGISSIVKAELTYGACKSSPPPPGRMVSSSSATI